MVTDREWYRVLLANPNAAIGTPLSAQYWASRVWALFGSAARTDRANRESPSRKHRAQTNIRVRQLPLRALEHGPVRPCGQAAGHPNFGLPSIYGMPTGDAVTSARGKPFRRPTALADATPSALNGQPKQDSDTYDYCELRRRGILRNCAQVR